MSIERSDIPRINHWLVQRSDGKEVIGTDASSLLDRIPAFQSDDPSVKTLIEKHKQVLSGAPAPNTEGAEEIFMLNVGSQVIKEPNWLHRVTDMVMNTTDVYTDLKEAFEGNMPSDPSRAKDLKLTYDAMLEELHDHEEYLLDSSITYNLSIFEHLGVSTQILNEDFVSKPAADNQLHKTLNNVLKQYIVSRWSEDYAGARGEIQQDRLTRLALHYRDLTGQDKTRKKYLESDKDEMFSMQDKLSTARIDAQRKLDALTTKLGLTAGVFEGDPVYWVPLGDLAPTDKAYSTAVRQLASGQRNDILGIIKGWPGGPEYITSIGEKTSKKKKKSSKKRPKKKKGSQSGTESLASTSVLSEETVDTGASETIPEEEVAGSQEIVRPSPSSSRQSTGLTKTKKGRLSKMEQMMRSVDLSDVQPTEKEAPAQPNVSADWDTIRSEMQREMSNLRTRREEEAKAYEERLSKLISDHPLSAALKSQVTDTANMRGRRAGQRPAYSPWTYSRRAPLLISQSDTGTKGSKRPKPRRINTNEMEWPALEGTEVASSSVQEPTQDDAAHELEDYSTVDVDPEFLTHVTNFITKYEADNNTTGLTPAYLASQAGGWDDLKSMIGWGS